MQICTVIKTLLGQIEINIASDSFIGENSDLNIRYQRAKCLKREIIYNFEGFEIAVGSVNLHQKTMINAFMGDRREDLKSACVAIGLDRLFIAMLNFRRANRNIN